MFLPLTPSFVCLFIQLEPGKETDFGKKTTSKAVMQALQADPNKVKKEVRYYVMFADITDHKNHEMGEVSELIRGDVVKFAD